MPTLTKEAKNEIGRQAKIELAKRQLLDFTIYTKDNYSVNWHHSLLCSYLDQFAARKIKRLMVFQPPRTGKSELVSRRLPAYILGKNPDTSIIATSYGADLASRMNRDVQRIIDSMEYRAIFPDVALNSTNIRTVVYGNYLRNSDIFEIVGHRGTYKCAGVGGAITGMGMEYGIIDDPYKNRQEAESETTREAIWEWYTSTFYTRLEKEGCILITLTRWHEDDLAGRLLRLAKEDNDADQWDVLRLPAIADNDLHIQDPRREGEALWPSKYPLEVLRQTKANVGSYDWASMYQQRPASPTGSMFKRSWWKFYRLPPNHFDEIIQSWDMSFKETKGGSYVVGQVWGRKGADKYLLDQVRARMDFPTTLHAVRSLSAKWPQAHAKLVEDKANGPAVIATLKREITGLIAVEPQGSKEARAAAVSPDVEAGNVYLPDPTVAPWIHDFIEELSAFPHGVNDDQCDSTTQALLRLRSSAHIPEEVKKMFREVSLYG